MDDWMEAEDHPHRPSNRPFPLSQQLYRQSWQLYRQFLEAILEWWREWTIGWRMRIIHICSSNRPFPLSYSFSFDFSFTSRLSPSPPQEESNYVWSSCVAMLWYDLRQSVWIPIFSHLLNRMENFTLRGRNGWRWSVLTSSFLSISSPWNCDHYPTVRPLFYSQMTIKYFESMVQHKITVSVIYRCLSVGWRSAIHRQTPGSHYHTD